MTQKSGRFRVRPPDEFDMMPNLQDQNFQCFYESWRELGIINLFFSFHCAEFSGLKVRAIEDLNMTQNQSINIFS